MLTTFFSLIAKKYIPLCCNKSNTSDRPPVCEQADDLGLQVLSLEQSANYTSCEETKENED